MPAIVSSPSSSSSPTIAVVPFTARASLLKIVLMTSAALGFYFVTSIALTVFNKWLFTELPKDPSAPRPLLASPYGFHYPLTVTCIHQAQVFMLVLIADRWAWLTDRVGKVEKSSSAMKTLSPIGALSGLDWGLSNTSLRSIPLSLYEMVKSASPVVVLIFSFGVGMTKATPSIVIIILLISIGTFLSVSGGDVSVFASSSFPLKGFIAVACATLLSGTRVVLTQFALQKGGLEALFRRKFAEVVVGMVAEADDEAGSGGGLGSNSAVGIEMDTLASSQSNNPKPTGVADDAASPTDSVAAVGAAAPSLHHRHHQSPTSSPALASPNKAGSHGGFNTLTALYYCAPASSAAIFLPALIFEGQQVVAWFARASVAHRYEVCGWIAFSSFVAFWLSIAELTVTGMTSALTMCVTGIAKQILIVGIAMAVFGDHLGVVNAFGFGMSVFGICLYNYIKYKQHHARHAAPSYDRVPTTANEDGGFGGGADVGFDDFEANNEALPDTLMCVAAPTTIITAAAVVGGAIPAASSGLNAVAVSTNYGHERDGSGVDTAALRLGGGGGIVAGSATVPLSTLTVAQQRATSGSQSSMNAAVNLTNFNLAPAVGGGGVGISTASSVISGGPHPSVAVQPLSSGGAAVSSLQRPRLPADPTLLKHD